MLVSFILLLLCPVATRTIGDSIETVTARASSQGAFNFEIDGTDANNTYGSSESVNFGNVDPTGTATTGDFSVAGTPIGDDSGVYYDVFAANGGNDKHSHPNSALGLHIKSNREWDLDVTAALIGDPTVIVGQLYWQDDDNPGWTAFSGAVQNIITNGAQGNSWYFHDYRLEVQYTDEPGVYTWSLTYTVTQK